MYMIMDGSGYLFESIPSDLHGVDMTTSIPNHSLVHTYNESS